MNLTPSQLVDLILRHSQDIDDAQRELTDSLSKEPEAEYQYRKARAKAWASAPEGPARSKEDYVDGESAEQRRDRDAQVAMSKALMELVRNKRQQLSALQSVSNAIREEAALVNYGADDVRQPKTTSRVVA